MQDQIQESEAVRHRRTWSKERILNAWGTGRVQTQYDVNLPCSGIRVLLKVSEPGGEMLLTPDPSSIVFGH